MQKIDFNKRVSGNPYYVFSMKTKVCSNLQETFTLSFCIAIDLLHDVNHLKIGWEFYWQRHQFQSMYLAARFLKVSIFLFGCSRSDEDINSTHTNSISSLYGAEECFSDMQSPINIPRTGDKLTFVSNIR